MTEEERRNEGGCCNEADPTISQGEIEVELLVALQLEGGVAHGEDPEGGAAAALGRDRGARHDRTVDSILVLDLKRQREPRVQVLAYGWLSTD